MDSEEPAVKEAAKSVSKAAEKNNDSAVAEFKSYLDGFDRTAYGAGSSRGTDRYSALDVNMNIDKGKELGLNNDQIGRGIQQYYNSLKGSVKHGGATARAMEKVFGMIGGPGSPEVKPEPTPEEPKPEPKPEPTPEPKPEAPKPEAPIYTPPERPLYQEIIAGPGFGLGGSQNVNQDNDITTNVTGDNNTVTNTQDNSINFSPAARSKYLRDRYVADVSRFTRA